MEIVIAFGCGVAFIIPPMIVASVSEAIERKRVRDRVLRDFNLK